MVQEIAEFGVNQARLHARGLAGGRHSYNTGRLSDSIHVEYRTGNQHGRQFTLMASAENNGFDYAAAQHNGVAAVTNRMMHLNDGGSGTRRYSQAGYSSIEPPGVVIFQHRAIPGNPFLFAAAQDIQHRYGGLLKVGANLR